MDDPEIEFPLHTSHNDPRRKVPRWYLHDGTTPFESQSCGIAARLLISGLLFDKSIGRAVIKDIGPGGVGFLAPARFELPETVKLALLPRIALDCNITHRRAIGRQLCFYGARWSYPEEVDLAPVLSHWRHCFMVPQSAAASAESQEDQASVPA
ncbi:MULTISPECIES: hypothetical protein [Aeromonas]|uniref:PilZ domain-containing protein n=1 Tax=Aeromonas veronii TaxID=654 RepID=A0A2N5WQH5_AERVE|nr:MULTISPECIES: hypothetical protein [Aeromonas]ATY82721.1 hypothetical protein CVS42_18865 [Aeromonas veronii]AYK16847.1 hypothetical protein C0073_002085 [Aeromonas veronii]MBL0444833.1 hypothetical protein [Aeromonas veronii]MCF5895226.1 hypothetical protein [Aeromonas veronii]MCJ8213285.1 hypothetical protein [Aeromonas veronii]